MTSAALVFRFDRARTGQDLSQGMSRRAGGLTIEVAMPYVHIIDTLVCHTRGDLLSILLQLQHQGQESFDIGCGYVIAI